MPNPVLKDLLVVDFSTLLPGPLATLILAEAGARVIKVERTETGDEMRSYEPKFGPDSANFALLNRRKDSLVLDLKSPEGRAELDTWLAKADILVEQFRPGVMDRLGLGYDQIASVNPAIIYCSITGYGQSGPNVLKPGHDLNYMAATGCLSLVTDTAGNPVLPHLLNADIGGGAYPAVMNILMAPLHREKTGNGTHIDVSMADNLLTYLYWTLGEGFSTGKWPTGGDGLVTGASPRYAIYATRDERHLAVAALEQPFWTEFCDAIGLNADDLDDERDAAAVRDQITRIIGGRTASEWREIFAGRDVCCSIVATIEEAIASPQVVERGLFNTQVSSDHHVIPALPLPLSSVFRLGDIIAPYPALGSFRNRKP
ncbi:MAG: CoA transferase [Fimbriimonadaceae bacterium]|nr:CoA transferase [Alphaproteobacteria bacterium]